MADVIITRVQALELGLSRFFTGNPCKRGHISERKTKSNNCIECEKLLARGNPNKLAYMRQYIAKNKEQENDRCRKWHEKNRQQANAKRIESYRANRQYHILKVTEWRKNNPDLFSAIKKATKAARRARLASAKGIVKPQEIRDLFKKQNGKCAFCNACIKKGYHADHIIPLSKYGENDILNIQLLCRKCNLSKGAKDPIKWAQENGKLI